MAHLASTFRPVVLAAALTLAAFAATAQPASAPGGPGPRASGPGGGMGMGMGPGRMMGRWGPDHTPGWAMMTEQERQQHQERMRNARTADECRAEMDRHRAQMAERAKERGQALPRPRHDACAAWK